MAAAGGVGLLLVQWLKHVGATVIGTVSTEAKAEAARGAGADHIILYTHEPVAPRVRELTGGKGVRVTFDGVGMATWEASLDSDRAARIDRQLWQCRRAGGGRQSGHPRAKGVAV